MKKILFVDDDPLVVFIYKEALSRAGFKVDVAPDGLSATKALHASRPDVMVLDLMMPRLGGQDVLKFVRSRPELATLPIVVLSNSFVQAPENAEGLAPALKALLKVRCTPAVLLGVVRELLEGIPFTLEAVSTPVVQKARGEPPSPEPSPASAQPGPANPPEPTDAEFRAKARQHFLQNATASCAALRDGFQALARSRGEAEREMQSENLYRKVHFLAAGAGLAECHAIARMASAFEAMLFEKRPSPCRQKA